MSTNANGASGSASDRVATRIFVAAFILVGVLAPVASFFAALGGFAVAQAFHVVEPPLGFARPHNNEVVARIDVLGKWPPDVARIRVSDAATGVTVWDVTSATGRSACWDGCWKLPRGTAYLFEVWDSKGRVKRRGFTL